MSILRKSMIGLSLLTFVFSISAKEQQPQLPDPTKMMEVYKKLATPGAPHQLFTKLVGSWGTITKEWMAPGKPSVETKGTAEFKTMLGGRYLQQEFLGEMMGQPYFGFGIDGYDNLQKKYFATWMDNMSTGLFVMEGVASADGKAITLSGKHPEPDGGVMTHRAVWKIIDVNNQRFEMYGAHQGGEEFKMMEIIYKRK